jgi:hypothetical protein
MNRQWCIHRNVVNIPTSIVVEASWDLALLENAVRLAVGRWDSFGLRMVRDGREWRQYFAEPALLSLERKDFRGSTQAEMDRFFTAQGAKVLPLKETPLARMWVFADPQGRPGVFSVINHLIMDSWSIGNFYADIVAIYQALEGGCPLPKPPVPYESVLPGELAYLDSARYAADKEYWRAELTTTEGFFTSLRGSEELAAYRRKKKSPELRACRSFYLRSKAGHVVKVVSAADVARCAEFLAEQRYPSMQLLFLLALRLYLAKVNKTPDVTIGATLSRRGSLAEKRTGGSRVHHVEMRSVFDEDVTFAQALDAMLEQQNLHYRHMDFPSTEVVMMPIEAFGHKPGVTHWGLLFTFQTMAPPVGIAYHTQWYCNGATASAAYLTIMDDDGSGGLRCYWEHSLARMPASVIETAHDSMVRVLRAGVQRPDATLGELMDLV